MSIPAHLTPTQLASHLACAHLTQLDRQRREGSLKIEFKADPRLDALRERGRLHEEGYVDSLRRAGHTVCDLRDSRSAAATLTAMQAGFDVIVQATLSNDVFSGIADVLLRTDCATSSLPGYAYEPADTKLSLETRPGTLLQLCTYADLLLSMQGVAPEHVHVVTPAGRETYRTAQFSAYHRLVRTRLQAAMTAIPPPVTYPNPTAHCEICTYWWHCDERRRQDDHPSLIAGIRTVQVREFQQQGLPTLAVIAQQEGRLPAPPKQGSALTYERLGRQARLQWTSRSADTPRCEPLPLEEGRGLARLPDPSPGDIFLDFEGDPFVPPKGLEYLTGFCFQDDNGQFAFDQRWALNAAQEKTAFEAFIDFAMSRLQHHPGTHVYHFGAYEPAALKRMAARHVTRRDELDQLLRGQRFVDLHAVVRESFCIGVERYGLKELEALHAFQRRLGLRDAASARRDVELALELDYGQDVPAAMLEQVALYNGDDCLSTESLRRWLERQRDDAVARGVSIVRPIPGEMQPSPVVDDRDKRIDALRTALLQGLAEDPALWAPDERAKALLAAMLGYYRQEEKNAWWEFFRLRDLPEDEHLEERQMLGALEFVQELPKQGKERNARYLFRFPAQETAIATGDKIAWPEIVQPGQAPETRSGTVEAFDLVARTVVLSIGAKSQGLPRAVFRHPVVAAKVLERALLEFAEHVIREGFDRAGPYAAASELLCAHVPRRRGVSSELRQVSESVQACLARLCNELDGGVLPVQGPPGAGKTTQAARAILALTAGKRIGVTAVSHKVIDNLLMAVRDAHRASAAGSHVELVHLDPDREPEDGIEFVKNPATALRRIAPGTIVGGTAWLWADPAAIGSLDLLIVDEAGQMALAQTLAAARAARNLMLLGDPQQLEQPARGAHEDGADVPTLVHLLGPDRATLSPEQGLFLDRTYRLHPSICQFTSEQYYEGRLQSEAGLERQRIGGHSPLAQAGLILVEVTHQGNQAQAPEEVEAVVAIARSLTGTDATWTDASGHTRPLKHDDILVVAPYNAQVSALRRALSDVGVTRVGTVDKFQGQEAPVVIYSCTSSSPDDAPRGMGFLYDPHRFNVATSRARCTVIVVASPKLFEPDCRTPEQMRWANGLCRFREMATRVSLDSML